jgi:hypothetical protein
MSDLGISSEVRAAFEPVLRALAPDRQALVSVRDVAAVRQGYFHPTTGSPVPTVLAAVTPGTTPVNAPELAGLDQFVGT